MPTVKIPHVGVGAVCHENDVRIEHGRGPLSQQATIGTLPDDALLQIFGFFADESLGWWHTLVHVCRRWRSIVFAFPRHLNVRLHCTTKTPVRSSLDVWPALPIVISHSSLLWLGVHSEDNIHAALGRKDRVCQISFQGISRRELERFLPGMREPFPELSHLDLRYSWNGELSSPIIPDSFLGGSAPRLRDFCLHGIKFPALRGFLLSASGIVRLSLLWIQIISPEAMVASLSTLTSLQHLHLSVIRIPQVQENVPVIRTAFPALTMLRIETDGNYLEDFVALIDAPLLQTVELKITFPIWPGFELSQFLRSIGRTKKLELLNKADVIFGSTMSMKLFPAIRASEDTMLQVELPCDGLSYMAQLCRWIVPPLSIIESLDVYEHEDLFPGLGGYHIPIVRPSAEPSEVAEWPGFLRAFSAVKVLRLSNNRTLGVAQALQDVSRLGQEAMHVLPALQNIFLEEPELPVLEVIRQFVAARQEHGIGHPIAIDSWERV